MDVSLKTAYVSPVIFLNPTNNMKILIHSRYQPQTYRHEYLVDIAGGFRRCFHEKQAIVFRICLSLLQATASLNTVKLNISFVNKTTYSVVQSDTKHIQLFSFVQENNLQNTKVKEVDLYSAFIVVPHTQGTQVQITQCYLQITPYLPLPRKHSPDGASPD